MSEARFRTAVRVMLVAGALFRFALVTTWHVPGGDRLQYYALSQELTRRGVTSMLVVESPSDARSGFVISGRDISEISDNTLVLSMELVPELARAIRIVKTRGSAHDGARHVLRISREGIVVE